MSRLVHLALLSSMFVVSSASAAEASDLENLARDAAEAEAALDYERAGELWMNVILHADVTEAQRFEAHLRSGIVQRVQQNNVEARIHFLYVLQRQPDFQLGPEHAPKIRNFLELVRQEVQSGQDTRSSAPTPSPAPAPAPEPPDEPDAEPGFPWLLAGGGAAVVVGVTAGVLGALPLVDGSVAAADGAAAQNIADYEAARVRYDAARNAEPIAIAATGIGAALLVAGTAAVVLGAMSGGAE